MWQIAVSLLDPKYIPIAEQYLLVYLLSHLLSSIVYLIWQSVDTNKQLWLNIKLCNLLISRWDRLQGGWEERGRDAEDVVLIVFQQQANAPCRGIIEYGQCMIPPSPSSVFPSFIYKSIGKDTDENGSCGFCYGDEANKTLDIENAFFFRMISDLWRYSLQPSLSPLNIFFFFVFFYIYLFIYWFIYLLNYNILVSMELGMSDARSSLVFLTHGSGMTTGIETLPPSFFSILFYSLFIFYFYLYLCPPFSLLPSPFSLLPSPPPLSSFIINAMVSRPVLGENSWASLIGPLQVVRVRWGEVRWGEVRWGEVRWGEVRWGEVRWGEVRWGEVRWGEVRWGEVRWRDVTWRKYTHGCAGVSKGRQKRKQHSRQLPCSHFGIWHPSSRSKYIYTYIFSNNLFTLGY